MDANERSPPVSTTPLLTALLTAPPGRKQTQDSGPDLSRRPPATPFSDYLIKPLNFDDSLPNSDHGAGFSCRTCRFLANHPLSLRHRVGLSRGPMKVLMSPLDDRS